MAAAALSFSTRPAVSHARHVALLMLFVISTINYADRATLSIAGSEVSKQLGLSKVAMGYAFSAFGWAYVAYLFVVGEIKRVELVAA